MLVNRSIPNATVIPVLVYPNVRAAVEWLSTVFGFVERVRIGETHRSQMRIGTDGAVIIAEPQGEQQPPQSGAVTPRAEGARRRCGCSVRTRPFARRACAASADRPGLRRTRVHVEDIAGS